MPFSYYGKINTDEFLAWTAKRCCLDMKSQHDCTTKSARTETYQMICKHMWYASQFAETSVQVQTQGHLFYGLQPDLNQCTI